MDHPCFDQTYAHDRLAPPSLAVVPPHWSEIRVSCRVYIAFWSTDNNLRFFWSIPTLVNMKPALMLFANRSFAFNLYDFHLEGISAKELAVAYSCLCFG
jgi:hypothetical protein